MDSPFFAGTPTNTQKACRLLVCEYPRRAIAIVSSTHALILRHNNTARSLSSQAPPKCIVEFEPVAEKDLSDFRPLTPRPILGTLGLMSVGDDAFLCVVTHATRAANPRPGETVEQIGSVEFFCLNTSRFDDFFALNGFGLDELDSPRRDTPTGHPCSELQKLLSDGSFYYSTDFDLTHRLQDRDADNNEFNLDTFNNSFLWNSFMIQPLLDFRSKMMPEDREILDKARILTSAARGYCHTLMMPQFGASLQRGASLPSLLTIISRLSCRRAGTRFNARGIDDDGNIANFVETETIMFCASGSVFSYVQVRGSVPVFWEQAAMLKPGQQKITITRSPDATQPAFDKHFEELATNYGAVHILNLLSRAKQSENDLINIYSRCVEHCPLKHPRGANAADDHALLRATYYDFHAETKGPEGYLAARGIESYIGDSADGFAYYLAQPVEDPEHRAEKYDSGKPRMTVVLQQDGIFRTNCLDCLDRTNLIQSLVSQLAVRSFLRQSQTRVSEQFWTTHSTLWADNGDALSKIYAGTGALKSSFTRHGKMSIAGAIADVRKSAERLYINNFADKSRQLAIDTLLGRVLGQYQVTLHDPITDFVSVELRRRKDEYLSKQSINIFTATFNLNGRTEGTKEDLSLWLCPPSAGTIQPEIVAVGFQEIVELSPQQIMNSDPTQKLLWENAVQRTLNNNADRVGGEKYILLRSGQLVGAALCIFIKASVLTHIKNVEGSIKKTGLSGMAGNKGAVAIRMDYAGTPLCFVTAHLAAGFNNYEERNRDYHTIHEGLRFQRDRRISNHDTVIWLGDFNYRIGLANDVARSLARRQDIDLLYKNDQLNLQMVAGTAFQYYSEGRITFLPTYKFDLGSDNYDTSEKARIPAWTDRVLWRGNNIRQLLYNSAPLKFSDHRPVFALFECEVNIVDAEAHERISRQVYSQRKATVARHRAAGRSDEIDEEMDLISYEAVEPDAQPASSNQHKWWLDEGQSARSDVTAPKPRMILNPNRPANPFQRTDDPDWISVSRPTSYCSVASSQFEHIPSPNVANSASSSIPTKLSSTSDSAPLPASIGRLNPVDEHIATARAQKTEPPPVPPARRHGTNAQLASTDSPVAEQFSFQRSQTVPVPPPRNIMEGSSQSTTKRPLPPVAGKPTHLKPASLPEANPLRQQELLKDLLTSDPGEEPNRKPLPPLPISDESAADSTTKPLFGNTMATTKPAITASPAILAKLDLFTQPIAPMPASGSKKRPESAAPSYGFAQGSDSNHSYGATNTWKPTPKPVTIHSLGHSAVKLPGLGEQGHFKNGVSSPLASSPPHDASSTLPVSSSPLKTSDPLATAAIPSGAATSKPPVPRKSVVIPDKPAKPEKPNKPELFRLPPRETNNHQNNPDLLDAVGVSTEIKGWEVMTPTSDQVDR